MRPGASFVQLGASFGDLDICILLSGDRFRSRGQGIERGFQMNGIARKFLSMSVAAAALAALSACATSSPDQPPMAAATPKGVEGAWIDAKGTGLSTFSGGSFTTVATDTGQKLADGSYTMTGATSVEINGTSLIR